MKKKYSLNSSDSQTIIMIDRTERVGSDIYSNYNRSQSYSRLGRQISKLKEALLDFVGDTYNYKYPSYIQEYVDSIHSIVTKTLGILDVCSSISQLESLYDLCMKQVEIDLYSIMSAYISTNSIDYYFVMERISFKCPLKEFIENLDKIKNQFREQNKVKDDYEMVVSGNIEKYKSFYGYGELKNRIQQIGETALDDLKSGPASFRSGRIIGMNTSIERLFIDKYTNMLKEEAAKFKGQPGYNSYFIVSLYLLISIYARSGVETGINDIEAFLTNFNNDLANNLLKSENIIGLLGSAKETLNSSHLESTDKKRFLAELEALEKLFNSGKDIYDDLAKIKATIESKSIGTI